jgi:hypothetical protein
MKHKVDWGPGYRIFVCEECGTQWREKSRHCQSPSLSPCPVCRADCFDPRAEPHYEWPTDESANLIDPGYPELMRTPHGDQAALASLVAKLKRDFGLDVDTAAILA